MKKLLFALVGLSMLTFGAANAQYKMTIHKTDNTTVEIDLNDISEVTFDQTEVAFEYHPKKQNEKRRKKMGVGKKGCEGEEDKKQEQESALTVLLFKK